MIQVTDLQKSFGSTIAVDGISFEVDQGETLGLLGPNGAGKTTTVSMILGALTPDGGSVTLGDGLDPRSAETRKMIGVAPQSLSLYLEFSAEENLRFFGSLYGLARATLRERIDWALELAALTDRRNDKVKTYSGGMKRRLNLACALVHDPDIILLDEPTVGVDPQSRNHIFDSIEQLTAERRTVIYTTHYMEEAQRLCDRVAIMDHGKLLDSGAVSDLIDRHGGRSVVKAQLMRQPEDVSNLPGPLHDLSLRFESEKPFEDVGGLVSSGVEIETLEVARPDLETVFLTLTGRSLRD